MIKQKQNIGYFSNGYVFIKRQILYDTEDKFFVKYNGIAQRYCVNGERAYIDTHKNHIEHGIK